ncbi:hypothetical protein [Pantanalinema sp. GBBB05]|uniref:hypothetical protein n=1 Tax=Pantanalinema sp. GBBB05 TaxID=2604139 RepID=UPI001DA31819|nr:hypothetical protein [Pantanalinema sp. GBBB05]
MNVITQDGKTYILIDELESVLNKLPESERSAAKAHLQELISLQQTTSTYYVQVIKEYDVAGRIVTLTGIIPVSASDRYHALNQINTMLTGPGRGMLQSTDIRILWNAERPQGGTYVDCSFNATGVVYLSKPDVYLYSHSL